MPVKMCLKIVYLKKINRFFCFYTAKCPPLYKSEQKFYNFFIFYRLRSDILNFKMILPC
jgi:hypothetical protein